MPIAQDQARINITYGGNNGDLPDPVSFDATDGDVKAWVTEAVRGGSVPGIPAMPDADFKDFVVDRFAATGDLPNRISIRPKTPFGSQLLGTSPTPIGDVDARQGRTEHRETGSLRAPLGA